MHAETKILLTFSDLLCLGKTVISRTFPKAYIDLSIFSFSFEKLLSLPTKYIYFSLKRPALSK